MASAIGGTLKHVLFLSRHFRSNDLRCRAIVVLLDLGLATTMDGFDYLKNAIVLRYEGPARMLSKEIYPKVGSQYFPEVNDDQVEQAIRSVIKEAWRNRDEKVWGYYFSKDQNGKIKCPTNAEFITRIVYFLVLWQGCSQEVANGK